MSAPERLVVWMHGQPVAELSRLRGRLSMVYTEAAREGFPTNTPLLSVSLPLSSGSIPHDRVLPFFEGLLPEGEARRMLAYDFRLQEDDVFGLLARLGRDCAGALVLLPAGEHPIGPVETAPHVLSMQQVTRRLQDLSLAPLGVDEQVRISLAGVQQKMVLSYLNTGDWALPVDGRPSTHILKRGDPRFPEMVANEAFCLAIGRHVGMNVVQSGLLDCPEPILVVTRYDRTATPDGRIFRIHQEDLTQAFGLRATHKYEERGGPSLRAIARLLRERSPGTACREHLLDITMLNMVVGNGDAHAKNFSLLHPEPGVVKLAPAYDILSTLHYPQADVRPGMDVNGKRSLLEISAHDVIEEAMSWGLREQRIRERVLEILGRFPQAIERAASEVPSAPDTLIARVSARSRAFLAEMMPR
jgi:serine/threonine-protein kinase HipA